MQSDFQLQNPHKTRIAEIKTKPKPRKPKQTRQAHKEPPNMASEESDLEKWASDQELTVNEHVEEEQECIREGKEWLEMQRKSQKCQLSKAGHTNLSKDSKVTYLEFDKDTYAGLEKTIEEGENEFKDEAFPAVLQSLTGQWGHMKKYQDVYWQRASKALQYCQIFQEKVKPYSIKQGKLGDCYFLSSLAALAEKPDRIFSVFLINEINNQKRFSVKVLVKGRWQVVDLDDYFPFLKQKPVFSRSKHRQLWVMILEKAWAKVYGSYMNIASGHAQQCLHDFTGAPIAFYKLKNNKDLDKDDLWKYLLKASKRQYAMTASSNTGSDTKMSQTGIVQGHCYTLLNATYLKFNGNKIRLVQLRNPWGRKQGKSKWHDQDPLWEAVPQKQRKRIGYKNNAKDGIFFMDYNDFLSQYRDITIAQINDNASYVYQTAKDPNCQGVCFKITLHEICRYSFQIDKTSKRCFGLKQRKNYRYPKAICKIFNGSGDFEQIHNFHDAERLTSRKYTLDEGQYYVYVKIKFNQNFEQDYEVTLAIYAEASCEIEIATLAQRNQITGIRLNEGNDQDDGEGEGEEIKLNAKRYKSESKGKNEQGKELYAGKPRVNFQYVNQEHPRQPQHFNNIQIKNRKRGIRIYSSDSFAQQNHHQKPPPFNPHAPHHQHSPQNPHHSPHNEHHNQNHSHHKLPHSPSPITPKQQIELIGKLDPIQQILQEEDSHISKGNDIDIMKHIGKQMVFLQASPAEDKLKQLEKEGKEFRDERFPPNQSSLCGQWGHIQQWQKIRWERISKMLPKSKIFTDHISPLTIKQGFLGNCYFLAGLAALAQKPQRITNLFLLTQKNKQNYYSVKMLYRGKWLTIDMDDYLPWMYDWPAFSNTAQGQLWVVLLEKAWAKMYQSYKKIQAGFPQQTLHDLTAAPIRHIYMTRSSFNPENQWKYLMKASQLEYAMVASSQAGADSMKSVSGIVQGHAYTLLQVVEVDFKGHKQRLVQLRNPWGKGQGSAAWADDDSNWKYISEQEKQRIGYRKKQDGVFFIQYEVFCKQFKLITVAQIDDNASYIYLSCPDKQKQGCYFTVTIEQKGKYSFQIDNTPCRTFQDHYHTDYNYPQTSLEMGMITQKGYLRKMVSMAANARTVFHGDRLDKGTYVCFVNTQYDQKYQKDFKINLAVYGEYPCKIELSTHKEATIFSNNPKVGWPRSQKQNKSQWNSLSGYKRKK